MPRVLPECTHLDHFFLPLHGVSGSVGYLLFICWTVLSRGYNKCYAWNNYSDPWKKKQAERILHTIHVSDQEAADMGCLLMSHFIAFVVYWNILSASVYILKVLNSRNSGGHSLKAEHRARLNYWKWRAWVYSDQARLQVLLLDEFGISLQNGHVLTLKTILMQNSAPLVSLMRSQFK